MRWGTMLAAVVAVAGGAPASRAQTVAAPGSATQYPTAVTCAVAGKPVPLALTGVALRKKLVVNVYAVGSYVQEGAGVKTAEQLAAVDCPKRLHLVMERTVDGKDMAEAFRAAIRLNHAEPAFAAEVGELVRFMQGRAAQKGDHVVLTHLPGVGLHCNLAGKAECVIKNAAFSKAVWEIYLGKRNLGEDVKKALVSRL